jgi:MFS family permease
MATAMAITRRALGRFGVRTILLLGLCIIGVGQLWLFTMNNTGSYQLNVLVGILLTSFGMGLVFPTASVAVTSGMGPPERGLAGGLFVTSQQVGPAIGLAALATIAAARTNADHGSLVSGYKASFLVATGIVVVAFILVVVQVRTRTVSDGTT